MPNHAQVLVVGAGPVGLTLANELARHGVAVRIVDKAAAAHRQIQGAGAVEPLARAVRRRGLCRPVPAGRLPGARRADLERQGGHGARDARFGRQPLSLRPDDPAKRDRAHARGAACAARRDGRAVGRADRLRRHGIVGRGDAARRRTARTETLTADWLVGCDGAHSAVRHGLGFRLRRQHAWRATGCWPTASSRRSSRKDRLHIFWHRDGILAFFPIIGDRWRVIADLGRRPGRRAPPIRRWRSSTGADGAPRLADIW